MVDEIKKTLRFNFEYHMQLAQKGDNKSYQKVLKNILPLLKNFIKKYDFKNLLDINSIAQETLIAIHKSSQTYSSEKKFITWAFAIAKFKIQDELRKIYRQKKLQQIDFSEIEQKFSSDLFDKNFEKTNEDKVELLQILKILPEKQQKIIKLLKIEGNSLKEVSNKMNMSIAATKTSAHRAYEKLKNKFGKK
jgi:RNA polymerase sigma-70 factor (ECF subfamily)